MAVRDDFLGCGEKSSVDPALFFPCVHSSVCGLLLVIAVTSSGEGTGAEGMVQYLHELSDVFLWHRLQTKRKNQNIVVLFVLSFGQAGCQTGP